ncbi:hypothetical protein ACDQ55_16965 [Chitinophaga sp. 30R24]|uniref:hypothetical protein n=1 Tax=Chitinophaga sp. 30R24 TaxID=3248838 RepID=UPI003B903ED5
MKKILLLCALMGAYFTTFAQTAENLNLRRVDKNNVPVVVTGAAERDYKDGSITDYFAVPAEYTKEDWMVTSSGAGPDSDPDYYSVSVERGGNTYYALYDKTGKRIASQYKVNDAPLPEKISRHIRKEYPGYVIESDKYTRLSSETSKKSYYRITIKKGETVKNLFYNMDGSPVR